MGIMGCVLILTLYTNNVVITSLQAPVVRMLVTSWRCCFSMLFSGQSSGKGSTFLLFLSSFLSEVCSARACAIEDSSLSNLG